ncbi:hypothetical protein EVAR_74552_1 [Eumeta japonica]|uniref:Uncharacterized protein n=1 Tax=Eumeta variegata TaxID=151549 RepID=A0A4C1TEU0_EUMVA|nr:hypothetical protein EVAR_74552_1 [Eumeta japonica]
MGDPSQSKWSPPPMDIHNSREVTSALLAEETGCRREEWGNEGGMGWWRREWANGAFHQWAKDNSGNCYFTNVTERGPERPHMSRGVRVSGTSAPWVGHLPAARRVPDDATILDGTLLCVARMHSFGMVYKTRILRRILPSTPSNRASSMASICLMMVPVSSFMNEIDFGQIVLSVEGLSDQY